MNKHVGAHSCKRIDPRMRFPCAIFPREEKNPSGFLSPSSCLPLSHYRTGRRIPARNSHHLRYGEALSQFRKRLPEKRFSPRGITHDVVDRTGTNFTEREPFFSVMVLICCHGSNQVLPSVEKNIRFDRVREYARQFV